jgi:hypothetical protein
VETRVVSPIYSCTQSVDLRPRSAVSAQCGSDDLKKGFGFSNFSKPQPYLKDLLLSGELPKLIWASPPFFAKTEF